MHPPLDQAIVLGAGLGTRLRPLTNHLPKPGVPLFHRPIAAHALRHLYNSGVRHAAVNTHYLADALEAELPQHLRPGLDLRFARERDLLGTGGGIRHAWSKLAADQHTVVMNGDIAFAPDLMRLMTIHRAKDAIATMVVRPHPHPETLGAIEIDEAGRVRRMLGKPDTQEALTAFMFTGVHAFAPRAFEQLPAEGCIIRRAYRRWVDEGERVYAVIDPAPWRDLGTHASYLAAHVERGDDPDAVHPEAIVRGEVTDSWVGPRAVVGADVRLERCVVWAETVVPSGTHTDALLGPFGVVTPLATPPARTD